MTRHASAIPSRISTERLRLTGKTLALKVSDRLMGVPGLDIPGFDIVSIAKGYGCDAERLDDLAAIKKAAVAAWSKSKPTVLEIPISAQVPPLI